MTIKQDLEQLVLTWTHNAGNPLLSDFESDSIKHCADELEAVLKDHEADERDTSRLLDDLHRRRISK